MQLFLEFQAELPTELIVAKLDNNQRQLYLYLDAVWSRNTRSLPAKHHGTLVRLYATYAPGKLLRFLTTSDEYPMKEALEETTMRGMVPERIYLLGRMGNTKAALELIMTELVDVEQAVTFCKEHDEVELWDDLINYSMDKPSFISVLLNNIGTHIDPRKLVEKIEPGLRIPGLKTSLIQIIRDYNLQVALQESCKRILTTESYSLLQRRVTTASRGLRVSNTRVCPLCGRGFTCGDPGSMRDVVAMNCG